MNNNSLLKQLSFHLPGFQNLEIIKWIQSDFKNDKKNQERESIAFFLSLLSSKLQFSILFNYLDETLTKIDNLESNEFKIPNTFDFYLKLLELSPLRSLTIPHLLRSIQRSIELTNPIISHYQSDKPLPQNYLKNILDFLQNNYEDQEPFYYGSIEPTDHPYTFIYRGSSSIQIGLPPESIKRYLVEKIEVPSIYIIPSSFSSQEGLSLAEIEFPIYFNLFIKKKKNEENNKAIVIGRKDQIDRVRKIFHESSLGPTHFYDEDISAQLRETGYHVDLLAERKSLCYDAQTVDDYATFISFDHTNTVIIPNQGKEIRIHNMQGLLTFYENDMLMAAVETNWFFTQRKNIKSQFQNTNESISSLSIKLSNTTLLQQQKRNQEIEKIKEIEEVEEEELENERQPFTCPVFGISFLGTSHGFDPHGNTTGFILWINKIPILVDPPSDTNIQLSKFGISPKIVQHVILTHCHSDHDSGVLQLILSSSKIHLYTTPTIGASYYNKLSSITNLLSISSHLNETNSSSSSTFPLSISELKKSYSDFLFFHPVIIGEKISIIGSEWTFDYAHHTIPTLRFKVRFSNQTIAYSADTKYDPIYFNELERKGVINKLRKDYLNHWLFENSDFIIHESGVPGIHTDIAILNQLPSNIKKKMFIVHCNGIPEYCEVEEEIEEQGNEKKILIKKIKKKIPVTHLRIPKSGIENTIVFPVSERIQEYSTVLNRFHLLCSNNYLSELPPILIYQIISQIEVRVVKKDTIICQQGEKSDNYYIIEDGCAEVSLSITPQPSYDETIEEIQTNKKNDPNLKPTKQKMKKRIKRILLFSGDSFGETALWSPSTGVSSNIRTASSSGRKFQRTSSRSLDLSHMSELQPLQRTATVRARVFESTSLLVLSSSLFQQVLSTSSTISPTTLSTIINQSLSHVSTHRPFVRDCLSHNFLFRDLNSDGIEKVSSIIDDLIVFEEGETIFREGDLSLSLYIIREGVVSLRRNTSVLNEKDKNVEEIEFKRISVGDAFGEISLLTGLPRTATAIAQSKCSLLELKHEKFVSLLQRFQNLHYKVSTLVEQRLREEDSLNRHLKN